MLRLSFVLALLVWFPSSAWAQQPPLLSCVGVRCKPPVCPSHLLKTGERKAGCCSVAICRPSLCAKVRCRPAVCARHLVKYGERTIRCCKIALCKGPSDCLYNNAVRVHGKEFPSADQSGCCTCSHTVVTCHNRYTCTGGAPTLTMPRNR